MTETRSLLPRRSTPLERVMEAATMPADPGVALVRDTAHPDRVAPTLLPWVAWGERVPHWPASEAERRSVAARSHRLHGLIGTPAGMRAAARLVGAQVRDIAAHPGRSFLGWWDAASRADWLAGHPQMRIYAKRERAASTGFMLGYAAPGDHPTRTDAVFRATSRAVLVEGETQTELSVREWATAQQTGNATLTAAQRGVSFGLHCGAPLQGYPGASAARRRVWAIDQTAYRYGAPVLSVRVLSAGYVPLRADVEAVAERAVRVGACCLSARTEWRQSGGSRLRVPRTHEGMSLGAAYPTRMDSGTRLYKRVWLFDPQASAAARNGPSHLGRMRLGLPAWEAQLRVALAPRTGASRFCGDTVGFTSARNANAQVNAAADVLDYFRAEHQRVLIDTRNYETLRARETVKVGGAVAGQINPRG